MGGVKGHNKNEISFPGSPGLWPGSFAFISHLTKTKGGEFLTTSESFAVIKVLRRSDVLEHWGKEGF
jgi:hypothetical protein